MKYQKLIESAFSFFDLKPRSNQVAIVNQILTAFVDNQKKFVVLNAPTGIGKSIIGAVVARCVEQLVKVPNDEEMSNMPALFLVGTNTLTEQYADAFAHNRDFILTKGANNYKCDLISEKEGKYRNAENCSGMFKTLSPALYNKHCEHCEYRVNKQERNKRPYLITNYSMFFISQLYSNFIKTRRLTIFDEAHTINDLFVDHMAINISVFSLKSQQNDLMEIFADEKLIDGLNALRNELENDRVNDGNYRKFADRAMDLYYKISEYLTNKAANTKDISSMIKFVKLQRKFGAFYSKLNDLKQFEYDHVFEVKNGEYTIKPVFANLFFNGIATSPHNLLMSATISEDLVEYMLGLDKSEYEFIKADPVFDPKNKKVIFLDPISINYKSLQEQKTLNEISKRVCKVIKRHSGENGIILVPSFKLGSEVSAAIRKAGLKVKLFEQSYTEKLSEVLEKFKKSKEPSVLVSPSLFEGVDLAGDLSRYQIIVKAPYPSLGDKRVKHILDNYPVVYELSTVLKLVQGVGRSTRCEKDYATTYMLDTNAKRIFKGSENIWKNEFCMSDEKL